MGILAVFLLAYGCQSTRPYSQEAKKAQVPYHEPNPEWCLALSGGGIRSGAVSLGVLQRLNEYGALKRFDYVSSVSGGGYPVYGLVYSLHKGRETLDQLLDEQGRFIRTVQDRPFIPKFDAFADSLTSVVVSPLRGYVRAIRNPNTVLESGGTVGYAIDIADTFGARHRASLLLPEPKLSDIDADQLRQKGLPYPIFVASVSAGRNVPENDYEYQVSEVFELSPSWIGSDETGWWTSMPSGLRLWHAITSSAAAIDSPRQLYPVNDEKLRTNEYAVHNFEEFDPLPRLAKKLIMALGIGVVTPDGNEWYLADGGFIDNQALLPLVNRGCRNIVALDASHDVDFSFIAVRRAQAYLEEDSRYSVINDEDWVRDPEPIQDKGWAIPKHIWGFQVLDEKAPFFPIQVHVLKLGIVEGKVYPDVIQSYIDGEKSVGCEGSGLFTSCAFPLQSTMQQNFERSEFCAYRQLGKLMVDELVNSDRFAESQWELSAESKTRSNEDYAKGCAVAGSRSSSPHPEVP